jgi:DNA-binding XRE family transcriptional regulator
MFEVTMTKRAKKSMAISRKLVSASDPDTAAMRVHDMDWYKEAVAKMTPSENLKLLRKNRSLTQNALAQKSGIAAAAISDMEHGRIPIGRKSAQKLAAALGTSVNNLFW